MALQVITGIPPIDLLVKERVYMYEKERVYMYEKESKEQLREVKDRTLDSWQERWNKNTLKGQWTKTLIQDIGAWVKCEHKEVDFYLTQALTGHGVFRAYHNRMQRISDDKCIYCGDIDTAEHTIFMCNRWNAIREGTEASMGLVIGTSNIVDKMIESRENWQRLHHMIKTIMKTKEEEERRRQRS